MYATGLAPLDYNSACADFQVELFPLHSPLLRESLLVSFPPLSYMLKFSGSSYLISGQKLKGCRAAQNEPRSRACRQTIKRSTMRRVLPRRS
jgi:hypothetical protein